MLTPKINDRVMVYLDPYTVSDPEDRATIKTTPESTGDRDIKRRPMYRCTVQFDGEDQQYFRTISEILK